MRWKAGSTSASESVRVGSRKASAIASERRPAPHLRPLVDVEDARLLQQLAAGVPHRIERGARRDLGGQCDRQVAPQRRVGDEVAVAALGASGRTHERVEVHFQRARAAELDRDERVELADPADDGLVPQHDLRRARRDAGRGAARRPRGCTRAARAARRPALRARPSAHRSPRGANRPSATS